MKRRLFATIIGLDRYDDPHFKTLDGAVRDARQVFDALQRTRMTTTEVVAHLIVSDDESLPKSNGKQHPKKEVILSALRESARLAQKEDTVLIYFAGHGVLAGGEVALVPSEGRCDQLESLLCVKDLQAVFEHCACSRRSMLLDACETGLLIDNEPVTPNVGSRGSTLGAVNQNRSSPKLRSRGSPTAEFLDHLTLSGRGWVILTSCGPGQASYELPGLDQRGAFSYYVALGLRGEADTDEDGTVGIFELAQYVSDKVIEETEMAERELKEKWGLEGRVEQVPQLICSGPMFLFTDKGAVTGDALPADYRRLHLTRSRDLPRHWWNSLCCQWPFEPVAAWNWVIGGVAVLYGALMSIDTFILLWAAKDQGWLTSVSVGALSAALWWLIISFAIASALCRYHDGGYIAGSALVLWQLAVLMGLATHLHGSVDTLARFGISQFVLLCIMIFFGCNAAFSTISLLDLERRKEEYLLRKFFREIAIERIRVAYPNSVACEAFHPTIYLWASAPLAIALLAHMATRSWMGVLTTSDGLVLLHDVVLLVLVAWLTSAYITTWYSILRRHPKVI